MKNEQSSIIIYHTDDGKSSVSLYAHDGSVWMNQNQLAELFATSVPNISMHISNILKEKELDTHSVIKDYLSTRFPRTRRTPKTQNFADFPPHLFCDHVLGKVPDSYGL